MCSQQSGVGGTTLFCSPCKEVTLLMLTVADPDDLVQLNPESVQRANCASQRAPHTARVDVLHLEGR